MNITDDNIVSIIISFILRENKDWLHLRLVNKQLLKLCKKVQNPMFSKHHSLFDMETNMYSLFYCIENNKSIALKSLLEDEKVKITEEDWFSCCIGFNFKIEVFEIILNHPKTRHLLNLIIEKSIISENTFILEYCIYHNIPFNIYNALDFCLGWHFYDWVKKLLIKIKLTNEQKRKLLNKMEICNDYEDFSKEEFETYQLIKDNSL